MQQMSNILLGNSGKVASVTGSDKSQGADNQSFLSVFNQASQMDVEKTKLAKSSETNVEEQSDVAIEEADVELIFAQIGMSENFDKVGPSDPSGKELPLDEELLADEELVASETLFEETELIVEAYLLKGEEHLDSEKQLLDSELLAKTQTINSDEQFETEVDETVSAFLSSLTAEQLTQLSEFSSMDSEKLASLTPAQINQLIADFNRQHQLSGEQALPLMALTDKQAVLANANEGEADGDSVKNVAKLASNTQANANQTNNASLVNPQSVVNTTLEMQASKNTAEANLNAEKGTILGEASQSETKSSSKEVPQINLSKAELTVSMDKQIAKNAALASSAASAATSELTPESTEVKALQNQSSFTAQHKSDVPQFQLSLRQGAEAAVNMQDMIQKFAPVMKQQLITMVGQGVQHAEIRLDPAELGHMVVRVQVHGEQTQVQFQVAQSQTRDLVEQAIPKLREMLAEEGLQLADSHVSQDGDNESKSEYDEQNSNGDAMLDEISAQELDIAAKHSLSSNSAIDYYA
ncbi:flagellar hook-length control protein FliK [Shewanella japonica]|uniref:flagellar hook-length control protein FliK n=1 Tax=Shewanella japonica TaxID=93973 RepID=UPI0024948EDE|nr:flagellar hook-length control protein FliK [Shewanella japonica]